THLRAAVATAEQLRGQSLPGAARTDVIRNVHYAYRLLARLLRLKGDDCGAFDAIQGAKGRRIVDVLAAGRARDGHPVHDAAPTAAEIAPLVASPATTPESVLVEIVAEESGLVAYLVSTDGVTSVEAPG